MLLNAENGDAEAAELVNDLRPLRGALSRVIDNLCSFGSSPIMGSCRSPLSGRKENPNPITLREKSRSSLTEAIHFGNDQRPASLRSDYWMLSLGSLDALRRNHCRVSSEYAAVGITAGIYWIREFSPELKRVVSA